MDISIETIIYSVENAEIFGGTKETVIENLNVAKDSLKRALVSLEDIAVKGKEPMNILLGCILAIEKIIGKKGE